MFTYRIDFLKSLGIDYESLSDLLIVRGKQYQRGPSFPKHEYVEVTEYCLTSNLQGLNCILVDGNTEFTVWLQMQTVNSVEPGQIDVSKLGARDPILLPQTPSNPEESEPQMSYRGIKYDANHQNGSSTQNGNASAQRKAKNKSRMIYRGVEMRS
ncbi:MAG: hypothetical protein QNJ46_27705 [Leptolyngbyaceae cyanobacterium MO_188.B28]|nr:hypothetical protein [Leptolyngbyaceae cyanobacterium MO_188.B28]